MCYVLALFLYVGGSDKDLCLQGAPISAQQKESFKIQVLKTGSRRRFKQGKWIENNGVEMGKLSLEGWARRASLR